MPTIVMTGEDTFRYLNDGKDELGGSENFTYYSDVKGAPEDVQKAMQRKGKDALLEVRGQAPSQQAQAQQAAAAPVTQRQPAPTLGVGSTSPLVRATGVTGPAAPRAGAKPGGLGGIMGAVPKGPTYPVSGAGVSLRAAGQNRGVGGSAPRYDPATGTVGGAKPGGLGVIMGAVAQPGVTGGQAPPASVRTATSAANRPAQAGGGIMAQAGQNYTASSPYYNTVQQDFYGNPVVQAVGSAATKIAEGYQALPDQANRQYVANATRAVQGGIAGGLQWAVDNAPSTRFHQGMAKAIPAVAQGVVQGAQVVPNMMAAATAPIARVIPPPTEWPSAIRSMEIGWQPAQPERTYPVVGSSDNPAYFDPSRTDALMNAIQQGTFTVQAVPETSRQIWRGSDVPDDEAMYAEYRGLSDQQRQQLAAINDIQRMNEAPSGTSGTMADYRVTGGQPFTPGPPPTSPNVTTPQQQGGRTLILPMIGSPYQAPPNQGYQGYQIDQGYQPTQLQDFGYRRRQY